MSGQRFEPDGLLKNFQTDTAGTRYRKSHFATSRRPASFQAPVVWLVVFEKSTSFHNFFLSQGCKNPGQLNFVRWRRRLACVCRPAVWNWLHIVVPAPRILRCLLDFWKACGPLFERVRIRILKLSKCDQSYQLSRMESEVFFAAKIHVVDGWITTSCRSLTDAHKTCCFLNMEAVYSYETRLQSRTHNSEMKESGDWLLETEAVHLNNTNKSSTCPTANRMSITKTTPIFFT